MEEQVGQLWHKLVSRLADNSHYQSQVRLIDIKAALGIYFRALGGDGGLQIISAQQQTLNLKRNLLQKIAGTGSHHALASLDEQALKLPSSICYFDSKLLNRDLYFWLAAMAATDRNIKKYRSHSFFVKNQFTVLWTLHYFPGLTERYARLVAAHLALRPDPARLSGINKSRELDIRRALTEPGLVRRLRPSGQEVFPVPLWLYPTKEKETTGDDTNTDDDNPLNTGSHSHEIDDIDQREAERVDDPQHNHGLITLRMENIFTWDEFAQLDRSTDDEDDADKAEAIARESEKLAVTRNQKSSAIRLKFDLDLPATAQDDEIITEGFTLPEWDWKKQRLIENCCHVVEYIASDADNIELPVHLQRTAARLKKQFQLLAPSRSWFRKQQDGEEIDLDAYLRYATEKSAGSAVNSDALYQQLNRGSRDLACLLVADLSLSTDSWVNNQQRVIDVIRDSLFLFAESLQATGDPFSMIGFSSRRRDPIRIHILKHFNESYNARVRGRIHCIKPGYYTRLGAAIRYASEKLQHQPASRRLLLIVSDGKPNDLDQYEGRYGIEDTREAILSARKLGLQPFCVTIDHKANQYLPYLFGKNGYIVIHDPLQMPRYLPRLYLQLTQ
jgi:nitric oxide reductase NorD protein